MNIDNYRTFPENKVISLQTCNNPATSSI